MKIKNFGKNFAFSPKYYYEPKSESEVLDILDNHRDGKIRCIGSGHAWNRGIVSEDVFLDIKKINSIKMDGDVVEVGGGCKLKDLIPFLTNKGFMLPAMGGIMEQSVAGVASTGTHGTGNSSFSHFIQSMKVAGYSENGNAKIYEYDGGEKLKAARASVGCMGVIVSMKIKCVSRYYIQESTKALSNLTDVLKEEPEWPLMQTVVIPYAWEFFIFRKKRIEARSFVDSIKAFFLRQVDFLTIEILPHMILKSILLLKNNKLVVSYYKDVLTKVLTPINVINKDYVGLTLHTKHHYYFRHVEMEVFIPEAIILEAFEVIKNVVEWFAGRGSHLSPHLEQELKDDFGKYTLHYTMFIRKVFPDSTLISMSAGGVYYAIGFFTYDNEEERGEYYNFTKKLAEILVRDYGARLHWGKHFPLTHNEVSKSYPDMQRFKDLCKEVDPRGVFKNDFTHQVIG
jgi:hypothetical protein